MKIHSCGMVMLVFLLTAMRMHASESAAGQRFERVSVVIAYQENPNIKPQFFYENVDPSFKELNVAITTDAYEKMQNNPAQFFAIPKKHIHEGKKLPYADDIYYLTVTDKKTFEQLQEAAGIHVAQWYCNVTKQGTTSNDIKWYEDLARIIDSDFARGRIAQEIIVRNMDTCEIANNVYMLNRNMHEWPSKFSADCLSASQKLTDIFTHYIHADRLQALCKDLLAEDFYSGFNQNWDVWGHLCEQEEGKRYIKKLVQSLDVQQSKQLQDAMDSDCPQAASKQAWEAIKQAIEPALKDVLLHPHTSSSDDGHDSGGIKDTFSTQALLKKMGIAALIVAGTTAAGYWWYARNATASDDNAAPIQ